MNVLSKTALEFAQSAFFPGLKIKPKASWAHALSSQGTARKLTLNEGGRTLSAVLVSPFALGAGSSSRGVAVLAHPISKKAKYYYAGDRRVGLYLRHGFEVLVFDFNGFGESPRKDFYYWKDVAAAVAVASQIAGGRHVVLHGLSFGSFHSIRAIDRLPEGSSVVLENTNRSLHDYWKRWAHTSALVRVLERLPIQAFRDMNVMRPLAALRRPDLRITGIACGKDELTPPGEMKELFSVISERGASASFELFEAAAHLEAPESDPARYESLLISGMKA